MHDDELKKLYQEHSNEQSPEALDKLILQQAQDQVTNQETPKQRNFWRWQPGLATAASVAVVILLAFQFQPLYWDTPPATQPAPVEEAIIQSTSARTPTPEVVSSQDMMESSDTDVSSDTTAEPAMMFEASPQAEEKTIVLQKQRMATQNDASAQQQTQKIQNEFERDLETLKEIQRLLDAGKKKEAKIIWSQLQIRYPNGPEKEPLKALWYSLKSTFE